MREDYLSIIDLPRSASQKHGKMSMRDRAAQFSPFAAMVGHDALIEETARFVDCKLELDESEKEIIDYKINQIRQKIQSKPQAIFTYFVADSKKSGGEYITTIGNVKKIDEINSSIVLEDGTTILVENILAID